MFGGRRLIMFGSRQPVSGRPAVGRPRRTAGGQPAVGQRPPRESAGGRSTVMQGPIMLGGRRTIMFSVGGRQLVVRRQLAADPVCRSTVGSAVGGRRLGGRQQPGTSGSSGRFVKAYLRQYLHLVGFVSADCCLLASGGTAYCSPLPGLNVHTMSTDPHDLTDKKDPFEVAI